MSNDLFGVVAVGADDYNGVSGPQTGLVQVFHKDVTNKQWEKLGRSIEGENSEDWLVANAVSGAGNILAVGAWENDDGGDFSGQVQVFEYMNGDWQKRGDKLIGRMWDYFGWSVVLSEDERILAVSAPAYIASGEDLVFE